MSRTRLLLIARPRPVPCGVAAILGRLLERHENALEILLADARAGIFHAEAHARASLVAHEHDHAEPDGVPRIGELERVGQEVRQHLLQPHVVAHHDVVGVAAYSNRTPLSSAWRKNMLCRRSASERRRSGASLCASCRPRSWTCRGCRSRARAGTGPTV